MCTAHFPAILHLYLIVSLITLTDQYHRVNNLRIHYSVMPRPYSFIRSNSNHAFFDAGYVCYRRYVEGWGRISDKAVELRWCREDTRDEQEYNKQEDCNH